ncbi:DUF2851 family protein [Rhodohalobacter barkolensis]|uniref:DUF2851 domain-containing protein n=1 Tax=Rhodohalobacter barkolensis TaxID=2053187 RepID=A0A2N0VHF8_9BACT|nr:DUF2851 family protein [Rhodohalobacter barkolensis]PKD43623.1 hypothetical protein CWD77_08635 [Rhodohalobacter barkolensis]
MLPDRYSESLLQWIWENLEFNGANLQSNTGDEIEIFDPGKKNHGAGPDFLHANIKIGGIRFYGHVEVHNHEKEWFEHCHHKDENFNSVVLHVVLESGDKPTVTSDGYRPALLNLKSYLSKPLFELLFLKENNGLPCSSRVTTIHQRAFELQIEKAHREYFRYKVNELMECYNSHLTPSDAWLNSFIQKVYSALGIPSNRVSMEKLFLDNRDKFSSQTDRDSFVQEVQSIAFSNIGKEKYNWNESGMRPGSQPRKRVVQAATLHYEISSYSVSNFLSDGTDAWAGIINSIQNQDLPGRSRMNIIGQTVFLPAIYLLGDLFHSQDLCSQSYKEWSESSSELPKEVRMPFEKSGFELSQPVQKMGLAHHYKRFCKERNCHRCEVFKSAINS